MSLIRLPAAQAAADLSAFDAIIDARSPSEFAEDHLPGAVNWPVLDDEERRVVGTLYKQVSAFEARKVGAALVARNIARHIDDWVRPLPRDWRPLVYCWRGGDRSGTLAWFLERIGFRTHLVDGGYKAFRAVVREDLAQWPARFDWRVLCGRTGSGKTRLLQALAAQGAQVLDLEALACHRGSVLGDLPGQPQPSQKRLDCLIWDRLRSFDPGQPVFVESESKRIGRLWVPAALIASMRDRGRCIWLNLPDPARVQLLLEDYAFLRDDPERLCALLDGLVELRGHDLVGQWQAAARAGRIAEVFADLMRQHYDPVYERSLQQHFQGLAQAEAVDLPDAGPGALAAAAAALLAR
jgi:tRNA 2-selenouridine synthase